ncbi:MAG: YlxR family protein [Deltaproteobacteria bacterium]|nr:YlxR family protein [Deltaproteobacteria bacterium]MBI2230999.1 YlxR family protein [Deltaproteobacteria bacterium]MBI2365732.1 YlxR family protein [Deltaproteobacteria bacterium]MBI3064107.1 YlxR family protein [Deltaproteobacteria bacterium]
MSNRGPQRTCLGCNGRDEQSGLIRLRVTEQGDLQVDKKGTGRGGYLHRRAECWQRFLKRKSLHRAFRVEIDKGVKERLVRELANC